jgi:hypothetical protein
MKKNLPYKKSVYTKKVLLDRPLHSHGALKAVVKKFEGWVFS